MRAESCDFVHDPDTCEILAIRETICEDKRVRIRTSEITMLANSTRAFLYVSRSNNSQVPIVVTDASMTRSTRLEQLLNAYDAIVSTAPMMLILLRL